MTKKNPLPEMPSKFLLSLEDDGTYTIIFATDGERVCALPNVVWPEGVESLRMEVECNYTAYYAHAKTLHDELLRVEEIMRALIAVGDARSMGGGNP